MTDLLTTPERDEFFAAIKDVTDTFHKGSVTYVQKSEGFDPVMRERPTSDTEHVLDTRFVKLHDDDSEKTERTTGSQNESEVEFQFNFEYLEGLSLTKTDGTNHQAIFAPERDFFKYNGIQYEMLLVDYEDSDFRSKPVICRVKCRQMIKEYKDNFPPP